MPGNQERREDDRRTFLKQAVTTTTTLIGIGGTAGVSTAIDDKFQNDTVLKDDPDFEPSDQQDVRDFVERTFAWSNEVRADPPQNKTPREAIREKRKRVLNGLSRKQKLAVNELLDKSKLISKGKGGGQDSQSIGRRASGEKSGSSTSYGAGEINTESGTQTEIGTLSCNTYKDTVIVNIKVPGIGSYRAFTFTQEIGWCVSNNRVGSVVPKARANPKSYILIKWDYDGKSDSTLSFHPEKYYAISYLEGRFKRCVLVNTSFSCIGNDYGYVEGVVYNDGSGRTSSKGSF